MKSPHAEMDNPVVALIRSRQSLQAHPDNATALFEQGNALCQLGQWEQALEAWEQVTHLEPDNAFAYLNRGIVYLQQEQWQEAEHAFAAAISRAPEQAEAHFGLGVALAQQGKYESAHAAWQDTLRLNPMHPEAGAHLSLLAQMSSTEVESLNVGSAQTLQLDCVISPPAPSERDTAVEESRIKLPPLIGPNLDTIAGAVVAAQEAREQAVAPPRQETTAPATSEEERREPTLKMDSKALKREHARLAASGRSSFERKPLPVWQRALLITGSAVVAAALTLWAIILRIHAPAEVDKTDTSLSASPAALTARPNMAPTLLPTTEQTQTAGTQTSAPVASSKIAEPTLMVPATSVRAPHARGDAAVGVRASAVHPPTARVVADTPAPRRKAAVKPTKRLVVEEDTSASAHRRHTSDAPATPHAPVRHAQNRGDEDTFATRRRPAHADNGDEWTDHIP